MKIGRNDPCVCGSGIKFKKCCLIRIETDKATMDALEETDFQEWFKKDCEVGQANLKAHEELARNSVKKD